jgi:hypothetical protein
LIGLGPTLLNAAKEACSDSGINHVILRVFAIEVGKRNGNGIKLTL